MTTKIIDQDKAFLDKITEKEILNLSSKFKRITDTLLSQSQEVFTRHKKNFKASWLSFLISIKSHPNCDVKDLAQIRNVSSSAVSQVVKELLKEELVQTKTSRESRSKLLTITEKGQKFLLDVTPELKQLEEALTSILGSSYQSLDKELDKLEAAIKAKSLYKRVPAQIKIEAFSDARQKDFERLNLEWFLKDFELQEFDKKILQDPKGCIVKPGGEVFFAVDGSEAVGTLALIHHSDSTIEISKMGVTEAYQGWGIGALLIEKAIEHAKKKNYKKIIILTHSKLKTAIKLYQSYGFKDMPVEDTFKQKYSTRAELGFELAL